MKPRGFTLVELLIATAIAGVAAAFMTVTVVRQQRFYSGAAEVLGVRAELRDGADVLVNDLRSAAIATFGLPVMTDTAVEMISIIGGSVACTAPAGAAIELPPTTLAAGHTLTSLLAQPDTGDFALLFGAGPSPDSGEWETHRIASFTSRSVTTTCSPATGFTDATDAISSSPAFLLTLASNPSTSVRKGAPVHFLRRARYSLYKSSDGEWYLGYRRCSITPPNSCSAIQPVSGPYRRLQSGSEPGMSFRYYDRLGAELADASQSSRVARIEIVLRGESRTHVAFSGDRKHSWRDSVVVSVAPRNTER
ncbi:MAG TPA: prepilin-type N-terminal cleavage/methylation domain-containing protein [Gemmatimonadaceae bacterium]|nr:prepilin-type N-terminal cleavage/methylation domain-containing protein [Gemmatimonadaceae bacterium]